MSDAIFEAYAAAQNERLIRARRPRYNIFRKDGNFYRYDVYKTSRGDIDRAEWLGRTDDYYLQEIEKNYTQAWDQYKYQLRHGGNTELVDKLSQERKDRSSALAAAASSAFQAMLDTCVNEGQRTILRNQRAEWISNVLDSVPDFQTYMSTWQARADAAAS